MRRSSIVCAALLISFTLACKDDPSSADASAAEHPAKPEPASEQPAKPEPKPEPVPEPPQWLLLGWDSELRTAPDQYAPALTLLAPDPKDGAAAPSEGRVIKVVGKADADGRWWQLETVAQLEPGVAGEVIEGLDFYALTLYVPAGTGTPVVVEAAPADPADERDEAREAALRDAAEFGMIGLLNAGGGGGAPMQSGGARPPKQTTDWQVNAGAEVYWPDGKPAGKVRRAHAFPSKGEARQLDGRALTCFAIRVGPPQTGPTQVCYETGAVHEVATSNIAEIFAGEFDVEVGEFDAEVFDAGLGALENAEKVGSGGLSATGAGAGGESRQSGGRLSTGKAKRP